MEEVNKQLQDLYRLFSFISIMARDRYTIMFSQMVIKKISYMIRITEAYMEK